MATGCFEGEKVGYTDLIEAQGEVKRELMTREKLTEFEKKCFAWLWSMQYYGNSKFHGFFNRGIGFVFTRQHISGYIRKKNCFS
nr:hypothetical protein [Miniphocaeibacter halophilus]